MAGPENIKAGFLKERDIFAENNVVYASPFVSLGDRHVVTEQLYASLKDVFHLDEEETARAVKAGFAALDDVTERIRKKGREILTWCAENQKPCVLVLARPYHMDTGIGHEIEAEIQACGYPILWLQYLPPDLNAVVGALTPGQRTPAFLMGTSWDRHSWYLRLPGRNGAPWSGVVRIECPATLPVDEVTRLAGLSQRCLGRFASAAYKDSRAPQNLYPIAGLERELRRRLGDPRLLYRALREAARPDAAPAGIVS